MLSAATRRIRAPRMARLPRIKSQRSSSEAGQQSGPGKSSERETQGKAHGDMPLPSTLCTGTAPFHLLLHGSCQHY